MRMYQVPVPVVYVFGLFVLVFDLVFSVATVQAIHSDTRNVRCGARQFEAVKETSSTMHRIEEHEEKKDIVSVCKYILAHSTNKCPIKCSEVTKACLRGESKLLPKVIGKANDLLGDVSWEWRPMNRIWIPFFVQIYGYDLTEIKHDKMGKIVLITSKLRAASPLSFTEEQKVERRLLFLVLSLIHMKGGEMLEAPLFNFFAKLDISGENNDTFGEFRKTITDTFPHQLYLKRVSVKLGNGEEERFVSNVRCPTAHYRFISLQVPVFVGT